jgi:hypothetical protein
MDRHPQLCPFLRLLSLVSGRPPASTKISVLASRNLTEFLIFVQAIDLQGAQESLVFLAKIFL